MNHEIDLKKYDIHTDLVLDTIENSSLNIKSDTYNVDDIKVTKVNIDEEPQIAEAEKIEIIPTLVLYRNGKAIDSIVAPESKIMIENFINEALEK